MIDDIAQVEVGVQKGCLLYFCVQLWNSTFSSVPQVCQRVHSITTTIATILLSAMSRGRLAVFAAVLFSVAFLLSPYSPINLSDPQPTFPQYTQEYQYPLEPHAHVLNQTRPKRVAIIGAGASGTSAAWFMTRAGRVMEQRMGLAKGSLLGEVVVYDREDHVGGSECLI